MKHTLSIFCALFLFVCASAQQTLTSKDVANIICKPLWEVPFNGEIEYYGPKLRDSVFEFAYIQQRKGPADVIYTYVNNRTGKILATLRTTYSNRFSDSLTLYYISHDSIFSFTYSTLKKRLLTFIKGSDFSSIHKVNSLLYLQVLSESDGAQPLYTINIQSGDTIKIIPDLRGTIDDIYKGVLICQADSYIFGFDAATFKTLWKINSKPHSALVKNEVYEENIIPETYNGDTVFLQDNKVDSTKGFGETIWLAMNVHTGENYGEKANLFNIYGKDSSISDIRNPALTDTTIYRPAYAHKYFLRNVCDPSTNWKIDVTPYVPVFRVHMFGLRYFFPPYADEKQDSDKLFAYIAPNLICLDRKTGKLLWNKHLHGFLSTFSSFITNKGFIVLFDDDYTHVTVINKNNPADITRKRTHYHAAPGSPINGYYYAMRGKHTLLKLTIPQ
jgi:hypothetical protein